MNTLLMAPELFTENGGIPRILRLYLKGLSDIAESSKSKTRFIALNDWTAETRELKRYSNGSLAGWHTCDGSRVKFVKQTIKFSRYSDRLICGHVAQLPVALAAKMLKPSLSYDVVAHGIEVWRPFTVAERIALHFSRRVFCISHYTRDQMRRYVSLPESRMPILYNGLDCYFPILDAALALSPSPRIVTIARLSKSDVYKGIDTLIEAMPLILKQIPDATLCIIGRGDDALRLRHLADKLALGNKVEMPGFVSDAELQNQISRSRLFALPSKKEGFGLVFIEAMARGIPCLGARTGGIPEVLTPEVGVLIDYGNIPQIASACVHALQHPWNPEAILARARHFSYENFRQNLSNLL